MNKKNLGRLWHPHTRTLLLVSSLFASQFADAQPVPFFRDYCFMNVIYPTNIDNAKNYSVDVIPGSGPNSKSIMAGTVWLTNDNCTHTTRPHFLALTGTKHVIPDPPTMLPSASTTYYHSGYADMRAADIAVDRDDPTVAYMTIWMRPPQAYAVTTGPWTCPGTGMVFPLQLDRDVFKVIRIDTTKGDITNVGGLSLGSDEVTVWENTPLPGGQSFGHGLYPISSLYRSYTDGQGFQKRLYVCGFASTDNTMYTDGEGGHQVQPIYANEKKAFVISIDVNPASSTFMQVKHSLYLDYVPTNSANNYDFDMAMRMFALDNTDRIFVTGSCNGQKIGAGPYPTRSATMDVIIDTALNVLTSNPFITADNGDGYGPNEFGIGLIQDGREHYIIGNVLPQNIESEDDHFGFNTHPDGMYITKAHTNPGAWNGNRLVRNGADWALGAVKTSYVPVVNSLNPNNSASRFIIAGVTDNQTFTTGDPAATTGNLVPFLDDVGVEYNSTTFTLQATNQATLTYYPSPNPPIGTTGDWNTRGGGLSSIYWNANVVERETTPDNIVFTGPITDPFGFNVTGVKCIYAQEAGSHFHDGCANWDISQKNFGTGSIIGNGIGVSWSAMNLGWDHEKTWPVEEFYNADGDCNYFRPDHPTGLSAQQKATGKTTIAPNPATDEISVTLASDIAKDAKVQVVLHNMMGQVVGKLYEGSAAKLTTASKLHLPAVASGMYTVQVISNGKTVHQQKLAIQ